MEVVKRIDVLFDIERSIMGETDARRHAVSQELSAPVLAELETWMKAERAKLSRRAQGYCPRPQVVAVRRLRPRWQALRGH